MAFMTLTRGRIVLIAVVVVLFAGYTLFGFFGVPRLLRSQATGLVAEHYQRKLDLGEIRFNPFTLVLRIGAVSFPDAQGQPLVGFRNLLVDLNASSLFAMAPSFASIELGEPFTNVVIRKDGTLNLADLSRPFAAPATQEAAEDEPLRLSIQNLRVTAGSIDFENHARTTAFRTRLAPIAFVLSDFSTVGVAGNTYELRAASMADERFAWNGSFAMTPFTSKGRFEVANLRATTLWSYLRDALPVEITQGVINLAGDYEFAARESDLRLHVKDVTVADVALRGHQPRFAARQARSVFRERRARRRARVAVGAERARHRTRRRRRRYRRRAGETRGRVQTGAHRRQVDRLQQCAGGARSGRRPYRHRWHGDAEGTR
jgi:hypothetical protein